MKREIIDVKNPGRCCPGHDRYPCEKYSSNRSTRARSRDKGKEHRHARRVLKLRAVAESKYNEED